jgi:hypothetical protein
MAAFSGSEMQGEEINEKRERTTDGCLFVHFIGSSGPVMYSAMLRLQYRSQQINTDK